MGARDYTEVVSCEFRAFVELQIFRVYDGVTMRSVADAVVLRQLWGTVGRIYERLLSVRLSLYRRDVCTYVGSDLPGSRLPKGIRSSP